MQNTFSDEHSASESSQMPNSHCLDLDSTTCSSSQYSDHDSCLNSRKHTENHFVSDDSSPILSTTIQGLDDYSKDICNGQSVEMEKSSINWNTEDDTSIPCPEEKDGKLDLTVAGDTDAISSPSKGSKDLCHSDKDDIHEALEQKIQAMRKTIERLFSIFPKEPSLSFNEAGISKSRSLRLNKSKSCKSVIMTIPSQWFDETKQNEDTMPNGVDKDFPGRPEDLSQKLDEMEFDEGMQNFSRQSSQLSIRSVSLDAKAPNCNTSGKWDSNSAYDFVEELNEMAEVQSATELGDNTVRLLLTLFLPTFCVNLIVWFCCNPFLFGQNFFRNANIFHFDISLTSNYERYHT